MLRLIFLLCIFWDYSLAQNCSVCQGKITQGFIVEPQWLKRKERVVSSECYAKRPKCYYCGRTIGVGGKDIEFEDHQICRECQITSVSRFRNANSYASQSLRWFNQLFKKMPLKAKTGFRLVEPSELSTGPNTQGPEVLVPARRVYESRLDSKGEVEEVQTILLDKNLSATIFSAAYVHELTHIWLQQMGLAGRFPPEDREGFAAYIEYRYYLSKGYPQHAERLKKRNYLHPNGMARFLALERDRGSFEGVVAYFRR